MFTPTNLTQHITQHVTLSLAEDIGSGDITAQLIPEHVTATARVITREDCTVAGIAWVNEVFAQVDPDVAIAWQAADGDTVNAGATLFTLKGRARSLLTGERVALNYLQLLSATATQCAHYSAMVAHTSVKILDTRKTLPGLRLAQKYAVTCGGCHNHRIGLFDAFLIKENHIAACGGIAQAIQQAHAMNTGKPVEIEVESLDEFDLALNNKADIIMLDNFALEDMSTAVERNKHAGHACKIEASGNVNINTLVPIAETGVDFISIGALTKDCKAIDLSMRFT